MLGYGAFIFLFITPGLLVRILTGIRQRKRFTEILASSFAISLVVVPLTLASFSVLGRVITASEVIFVVALWLMAPVIWKKNRPQILSYLQMVGLISIPGVAIAVLRPDAFYSVVSIALSGIATEIHFLCNYVGKVVRFAVIDNSQDSIGLHY